MGIETQRRSIRDNFRVCSCVRRTLSVQKPDRAGIVLATTILPLETLRKILQDVQDPLRHRSERA